MKPFYGAFLLVAVFTACSTTKKTSVTTTTPLINPAGKLYSSLYQQRAAEYHALCLQAYNLAHWRLDELITKDYAKPKAIITDIDETVLDNSPYAVHQALLGKDYEAASWHEWTARVEADTVPGALTFLRYASSKGVEIFYITNRDEQERAVTLQNLQHFGFPNADNAHLQLKQKDSGKETRRQQVLAAHDVILLFGDNLSDFSALFDKKMVDERLQMTKDQAAEFGSRFIVLPNPDYGDWESAVYRYNNQLTVAQKDSIIRSSLRSY